MKPEQQELLAKPFEAHEHGFKNGNCYIRKSAIRRRLSQVDPQWKLTEPEFICVDGDVVIMRGGLTVCGITRYQIGSGIIQRKSEGKTNKEGQYEEGKPLEGYSLASMVAKAYKTAATDILSRAAVEFNVAGYLKDASKEDRPRDQSSLSALLNKLNKATSTHWSGAGGRERVMAMLKHLGMDWNAINALVEPDRVLATLSETTLPEAAFMARLVELAVKPAQPKAAAPVEPTPVASVQQQPALPIIRCETRDLDEGDVILQQSKSQTLGTVDTKLEILHYGGRLGAGQYMLKFKNLGTDEIKTVTWSNSDHQLIDGPKCKAYAADHSLCEKRPGSIYPMWIAKPASV